MSPAAGCWSTSAKTTASGVTERTQDALTADTARAVARYRGRGGRRDPGPAVRRARQRRLRALPGARHLPRPESGRPVVTAAQQYSPTELSEALGLFAPTTEQAAVIAAPPGPLVVIAGAGAGKTETMAARVVWLVANGYARPSEVLGLTFTRKAAGQLLRRVRTRLARLAGTGIGRDIRAEDPRHHQHLPRVRRGICCAITDCCCRSSRTPRLIGATELWQLAFRVVCEHPRVLDTEKSPAAVTALVLRLAGALSEHLVDTTALRDTHTELERLIHHLPAGGSRADRGPAQWLLKLLATQNERTELVPLIDELHRRMRAEKVMDFGAQMSAAARLAVAAPQVGAQLRQRYRVVLLDEYQDTGHAQRIALSSLFGGGVDDGLALTAVGDPIQSIYGWRGASATNLPRFATDFPHADGSPAPTLELRTSWRNPPGGAAPGERGVRAGPQAVGERARTAAPTGCRTGHHPRRTADRCCRRTQSGWPIRVATRYRGAPRHRPTAAVLVRRNADAAPMAEALTARGIPVEVVGLAGLLAIPEVADVVAMLRLVVDPTGGAAAMRVLTGPRWRLGARDIAALWQRAVDLDAPCPGEWAPMERIVAQAAPDADTACLADAICDPGPAGAGTRPPGTARIVALGPRIDRCCAPI